MNEIDFINQPITWEPNHTDILSTRSFVSDIFTSVETYNEHTGDYTADIKVQEDNMQATLHIDGYFDETSINENQLKGFIIEMKGNILGFTNEADPTEVTIDAVITLSSLTKNGLEHLITYGSRDEMQF